MIDASLIFQLAGIGIITFAAEGFLRMSGQEQYAILAKIAGGIVCTLVIVEKVTILFEKLSVFARW